MPCLLPDQFVRSLDLFPATLWENLVLCKKKWPHRKQLEVDDQACAYFLVWGEKFSESDWKRIETGKNQLRPDLRATVWVCDNGENPVVDWQPAKD